ncbi:MAG TPA: hypothetical protein VIU44_10915, partial [Gaiellaceae bacterium]
MTPQETEKGFGTGLREQLERRKRKGEPVAEVEAPAEAEADAEVADAEAALAAAASTDDSAALEELRAELTASLERERDLRASLAEQVEAYERELDSDRDYALRSGELEQRASKLAA